MSATTDAREVVIDLLRKHNITDARLAKRLARERFSQDEWDAYLRAIKTLDAMGELN